MKIKSLFFALCMVAASANAQFTFIDSAGTPVESGLQLLMAKDKLVTLMGFTIILLSMMPLRLFL